MRTEKEKLDYINKECGTNYTSLNKVDWEEISVYLKLSESFIREFQDEVDWHWISVNQNLSEDFIREFQDKLPWNYISFYQNLSEDFIREFQSEVYWGYISECQTLSESFIREFKDKVDWYYISRNQKLSEDFIKEFQNEIHWWEISTYQTLSEDFIRKFKDKVDWDCISRNQKLSENFIKKFKNKVDWVYISVYQKLSEDFIKKFKDYLGDVYNKSWLYKDKEFLKQQVIESGLYECYDDYFIAYKGVRSDRYSNFNFQYQYLKGDTYEAHCDCTDKENSFGLSVWTEEEAKNYCKELIIKVKVNYEDVGRLVHNNGKIRVRKLTVLD